MTPTRRDLLATLAVLLAPRSRPRSVVWVWLAGGPPADVFPGIPGYGHTITSHTRATHLTLTGVDHPGIDDGELQVEPSIGSRIAADRGPGTYVRIGRTACDGPGRLGPAFAPRDVPPTGDIVLDLRTARRECANGAAFVLVHCAGWDLHADIDAGLRRLVPPLHAAMAEFVEANRNLLVVTGEFGRTRTLNRHGGRDHDPSETPLLIAGATPPPIRTPSELVAFVRQTATGGREDFTTETPRTQRKREKTRNG